MAINLNLELTDHCNIKCKMCSQSLRDEAHGVPMRFMDWATWRRALLGLQDMAEDVHLCPHWLGEPTIHPEFDRFVEYAFAVNGSNRLFREFKLHTNGVVFGEARARPTLLEVDNVVLCAGQEPLCDLYEPLQNAAVTVHKIGGADVAAELDAKRAIDQGSRLAARL